MKPPRKYSQCPKCGAPCHWRWGVHFDHEMICSKCSHVFDPDEQWQQEQAERRNYDSTRE